MIPSSPNTNDKTENNSISATYPFKEKKPSIVKLRLPTTRPWVCYLLIGLSITVYLLQMISKTYLGYDLPAFLGAKVNEAIQSGQFYRLMTPILLHGSLIHIGFNMYALYTIGPGLERYYNYVRFFLLYIIGGIAGNVISLLFSPNPSLGASTAIFALIAAEGVFIYKNPFLFGRKARPMMVNILFIMFINLVLGLSPGIDNWGHFGGLLGGLMFAWFAGPVYKVSGQMGVFHLVDQHQKNRVWLTTLIEGAFLFSLALFNTIL